MPVSWRAPANVEIAAILVNYNAGAELRDALHSVASELSGRRWEAVVVDNHSVDGSEIIASEFAPHVRLVRNDENVGFGRAVNQGIAATTAPLLLIMNPDCRLVRGALVALEKELCAHADCAIVGPQILDPGGAVQGSARGDPDMWTGLFGRTTLLRKVMPTLAVSRRNVIGPEVVRNGDRSVSVDWLSGACMLTRRAALQEARGFDERYFLYWEDADLCRRLRTLGYHVRYVPGAMAVHRVGHSSRLARRSATQAFHDSAYLYYSTHVAPRPLQPKRLVARALLSARCWLHLRLNIEARKD
jgi:GT2 family glycosyltransferase